MKGVLGEDVLKVTQLELRALALQAGRARAGRVGDIQALG